MSEKVRRELYALLDQFVAASGSINAEIVTLQTGSVSKTVTVDTTSPVVGGGDLTENRTISINQATTTTDGYVTAVDWNTFNNKLTNPMTTPGDMIYGGTGGAATVLPIGAVNTVLHGGVTPSYSAVAEADLTLTPGSTVNDATAAKHGFCPTLSNNALQYLNGAGNWVIPAGSAITNAYTAVSFSNKSTLTVQHNFGAFPITQVIDHNQAVLVPTSITNTDVNTVDIVFTGSSTGTVLLSLGSPQAQSVVVVTNDYSASAGNRIIKVNTEGKTVTLMTAVGNDGKEFAVDNGSVGNIYVDTQAGETINNVAPQTVPPDSAIYVYSDGINWRIY